MNLLAACLLAFLASSAGAQEVPPEFVAGAARVGTARPGRYRLAIDGRLGLYSALPYSLTGTFRVEEPTVYREQYLTGMELVLTIAGVELKLPQEGCPGKFQSYLKPESGSYRFWIEFPLCPDSLPEDLRVRGSLYPSLRLIGSCASGLDGCGLGFLSGVYDRSSDAMSPNIHFSYRKEPTPVVVEPLP